MTRPFDFTRAILRAPGKSVVNGLRASGGPDPTFSGICAEHAAYAAALEAAGLAIAVIEPLEQFPDAIFVEDPALVFPETAIMLNPGTASRAGEVALLRPELEAMFPQVMALPEGQADGGDVLVLRDRVLIGLSARTDRIGAAALAALLGRLGRKAEVVETPPEVLHLKTACSLIAEDTVLATAPLTASTFFAGCRVIAVPEGEERGANVLRANNTIIAGNRFPRILDLLGTLDAEVVALDNAEIEKIDAGFTCMSLRW